MKETEDTIIHMIVTEEGTGMMIEEDTMIEIIETEIEIDMMTGGTTEIGIEEMSDRQL